jgi:carbon starvation protein
MIIWPLFGATNQLLAGLTLLVISVMLARGLDLVVLVAAILVALECGSTLARLRQGATERVEDEG